jgi:riboflavin synthase
VELVLDAPQTSRALAVGSSVAVNGVCLTAVAITPPNFRVQAVGVTMERTNLHRLSSGKPVNLEPSLRVGDEIGGHWVTGHVDGVGRVERMARNGDATMLTVSLPEELVRFATARGSIAVDGTSLTVAETEGKLIVISLIPHTMERTIAGGYASGDGVNIEVDLLARYLDRLLDDRLPRSRETITWDLLKEKFS